MSRFLLEKSTLRDNWWVLTDTENLVVIQFQEHNYNDTKKVTFLEDSPLQGHTAASLATVMREIGEYMVRYHGGTAFDEVYGLEYGEDDEILYLCRYKFPCWRLELTDNVDKHNIANTLNKAAEWLRKGSKK